MVLIYLSKAVENETETSTKLIHIILTVRETQKNPNPKK